MNYEELRKLQKDFEKSLKKDILRIQNQKKELEFIAQQKMKHLYLNLFDEE